MRNSSGTGVPILPVVYQGPLTFKDLIKRKKATVRFGKPIYLPKDKRISREELAAYDELLGTTFRQLDQEIDPDFVYIAQ